MCIVTFRWAPDSDEPLLLAANRDEFYERPTERMHWWPGDEVLAGRDLRSGGAWLGITRHARFAMVTNIRNPALRREGAPSRGELVKRFLVGDMAAQTFVANALDQSDRYEGFNLAVPEARFDAVCAQVNAHPEVAHNYRREHALNMWFVVAAESPERAQRVLALQEQPGIFFTVVQVALNAIAIMGGIVGEQALSPHLAGQLHALFGPAGWIDQASFLLSFLLVTSLFIVFADLMPKRLAMTWPEQVAVMVVNIDGIGFRRREPPPRGGACRRAARRRAGRACRASPR